MNKIKCMIADDEPIARDIIKKYIADTPGFDLVKSCMNATEAYEGLYLHEIDLLFLDIRMPVISGLDFLRSLRNPPLVILTTAYHEYAIEGYELNVVDYLLKPVTYNRFLQAVQKAAERLTAGKLPTQPAPAFTFIRQDHKLIKLNFDEIIYIEAQKDYCSVVMEQKKLLASMHLKLFENILPPSQFERIHRSFIINIAKVTAINGNSVTVQKYDLPVGASYKEGLLKKLGIT